MGTRFLKPDEIKKFNMVLDAYQPNGQVIFDFANSSFGVIAGPTGAGKDTVRNQLLKKRQDKYKKILSTTTRPPREGEQDGVEYHFRNLDFLENGLDEKRLLQAELIHDQQISGLDFADIDALDAGHYGLSVLNVQAEKKLRQINSDLKTVFLIPPTLEEMMRRIHNSRSMKDDEVNRRLEAAKIELELALDDKNYYHLVNDNLEETVVLSDEFFTNSKRDIRADQNARSVVSIILSELSNNYQ